MLCLVDRKIGQRATNGSSQNFSRHLDARETNPSVNTVLRLLKESGLFGGRPAKKPLISAKNRKVLLDWDHVHKNWVIHQWRKAIKSDKPKFLLSGKNEIKFV
nr:Transposase domain containing protein [Haemonchus contortus]